MAPAGSTVTVTRPSAGTPWSESFHDSSRCSEARAAAEIGTLDEAPSIATPVEQVL